MNKSWYRIKNEKTDKAEIYLYGDIGWEVTASQFARDFSQITANAIDVHINSQGGYVNDGTAIYTLLRNSGKTINVQIDGNALSIAAYIAMAGDTVAMAQDGFFLVHKALAGAWGNSDDLQETIDHLEQTNEVIANRFAAKTGKTKEEMLELMDEDRYLTANEAKEYGFVDTILDELGIAAYTPAVNKFRKPDVTNSAEPTTKNKKEKSMIDKNILIARGIVENSASDADAVKQLDAFVSNSKQSAKELEDAKALLTQADEKVTNLKSQLEAANDKLIEAKVSNAVDSKIINEDQKEAYKSLLKADPDAAEAFINKASKPVAPTDGEAPINKRPGGKQLSEMTFTERHEANKAAKAARTV